METAPSPSPEPLTDYESGVELAPDFFAPHTPC